MNEAVIQSLIRIQNELGNLIAILAHQPEQKPKRTHIGVRVRDARISKGLTMEALSKMAKCSHGYISDLENGKIKKPSYEMVEQILKAME